jgi:hypothetical protein
LGCMREMFLRARELGRRLQGECRKFAEAGLQALLDKRGMSRDKAEVYLNIACRDEDPSIPELEEWSNRLVRH